MAKSARASSRKKNNQRKAANIFGPAESVRAERLSAKLLELAKQPKSESSDVAMKTDDDTAEEVPLDKGEANDDAMEVDLTKPSSGRITKKRVDKRRQKSSGIVFQKYSDRLAAKKKKSEK